MQKLIAMLCLLSAFFTTARSRAADECVAEATDVANAKGDQDAKFFEAADKPATLKLANPCAAGTTCPVVYFARQKLALEVPKGGESS